MKKAVLRTLADNMMNVGKTLADHNDQPLAKRARIMQLDQDLSFDEIILENEPPYPPFVFKT
jgi:hypothetical protein